MKVMYCLSLRVYKHNSNWGRRRLGRGRYALDLGKLSLVFEKIEGFS